jgi:hypothetical protein
MGGTFVGFRPIGVHDNFFEDRGRFNSEYSNRSQKQGKKGSYSAPNQLFEHQTISELAASKTENKKTSVKKR